MDNKILVAYATKYGSTQEVAQAVAEALHASGLAVDLQPVSQVRTLAGYGAVVLGAPFYMGTWHKDALAFLARQRDALMARPVAIFALGPTRPGEMEDPGVHAQFDKVRAQHPWLAAVELRMFGGKYDPTRLRFPDTLIAALPASPSHGQPACDARDWSAIRAWANSLPAKLQSMLASAA